MLYSLTPIEEGIAAEIGYQRQKPFFGNPEKNINYAEGDIWEMWQHAICAGAELAFARMMGKTDFVPHYNKFKNEYDIPGLGEVRYTFSNSRGLRFTTRDNPNSVYVLMTGGPKNRSRRERPEWSGPEYEFVGWAFGSDCMNPEWRYNETTWYMPKEFLRFPEDFV